MLKSSQPNEICGTVIDWIDGVKTGNIKFVPFLPIVSEYIPAMIPGHLIVVSGYTSAGKSQFLSQICCETAGTHKADTLVISVEDSRMEKMMSMIAVETGIHKRNMLMGTLNDQQLDLISSSMGVISEWPLHIYDDVYTLLEIESLIVDLKPKVVIIDYIQNLQVEGAGIYERMSGASQKIFQMAQQHNATMIVASQVSNEAAKDNNENVISLKGAGELAAASHAVIQLRKGRSQENYSQVEIAIKKNKAFGPCGTINATFNNTWTIIEKETEYHQIHSEKIRNKGRKDE